MHACVAMRSVCEIDLTVYSGSSTKRRTAKRNRRVRRQRDGAVGSGRHRLCAVSGSVQWVSRRSGKQRPTQRKACTAPCSGRCILPLLIQACHERETLSEQTKKQREQTLAHRRGCIAVGRERSDSLGSVAAESHWRRHCGVDVAAAQCNVGQRLRVQPLPRERPRGRVGEPSRPSAAHRRGCTKRARAAARTCKHCRHTHLRARAHAYTHFRHTRMSSAVVMLRGRRPSLRWASASVRAIR